MKLTTQDAERAVLKADSQYHKQFQTYETVNLGHVVVLNQRCGVDGCFWFRIWLVYKKQSNIIAREIYDSDSQDNLHCFYVFLHKAAIENGVLQITLNGQLGWSVWSDVQKREVHTNKVVLQIPDIMGGKIKWIAVD